MYLYIIWVVICVIILVSNYQKQRVGFCMLVKDDIPTQFVWNSYLRSNPNCILVIHGKENLVIHPECTELIRRAQIIKNPIKTSWGDLSLVRAQNMCIKELLNNLGVKRICTVSGNCVPIRSEGEILKRLEKEESVFTEFNVPDRLKTVQDDVTVACPIKRDAFKLHSQWCILTREHAKIIVNEESSYIDCFQNTGTSAKDETVYLTTLNHKNQKNIKIIPCIQGNDNDIHGTTFSHWKNVSYKFKSPTDNENIKDSSPKEYSDISSDEFKHLLDGEYLFIRKFTDDTTIDGTLKFRTLNL